MYPADKKNPKGKLRCLYEAYPMGLLVEQAGGKAIDGVGLPILDQNPDGGVHDRSPIFLGSTQQVERVVELMKEEGIAA